MTEYLPNVGNNNQLYKKAYLVEFYGNNPTVPEDVFAFSIPPESEELTYPPRKTEVKTFGGLHIDRYGFYEVKINLSGSTINQTVKRIYGAEKGDKWLSGEDEIYYFRDLMLKYESLDFLSNNKNAKIIIYDLSKFTGIRSSTIDNYWLAFPGEPKIRRANDRPFTYKYTFEFTGVPYQGIRNGIVPAETEAPIIQLTAYEKIINTLKSVLTSISGIESTITSKIEQLTNGLLGYVTQITELLDLLGQIMSTSASIIPNILEALGRESAKIIDGATSIISSVNNVMEGVNSVIYFPREMILKAQNIPTEIQNAINRLKETTSALVENCQDMFELDDYWDFLQKESDQNPRINEENKDSINLLLNEAENAANVLVVWAKSNEIPSFTVGNTDPKTGNPRIIMSYGYIPVTLKATDSPESIATEYMGDPERAIDILTYNNIASLSELSPGDIINIPITTRTIKMRNNYIFSRREDRDNYGRDVLLTYNGFIVTSNTGDYALATGVNNLSQAALLRLRESNSKRIRVNTYGIRKSISDQVAGVAYITSSINMTLNNDPRVANVDDIQFKGVGDSLLINVFYHDINNNRVKTSGRI